MDTDSPTTPVRVCYARPIHEGRLARSLPVLYAPDFREVRLAPGRMAKAAAWSDLRGKARPDKPWIPPEMPRLIFVSDMSDALSAAVPFAYLEGEIIAAATSPKGRRHIWQWLTKRPSRMAEFARWLAAKGVAWPENLWAGTSITGRKTIERLQHLARVPARVRFASVEPLVEMVDLPLRRCEGCGRLAWEDIWDGDAGCRECGLPNSATPAIHHVLIGGESRQPGCDARPFDIRWARDLILQCRAIGAAPFLKQLGSMAYDTDGPGRGFCAANLLEYRDSHGGDWDEWEADLRVREFPEPAGVARA